MRRLRIVTGCTAAGKTAAALEWAERHGAEILSCDSLLFYRGMDIGTAKPTADERARVPHHLVDVLPVSERMDVVRYGALALAAALDADRRGRRILVVGGSGFYLQTFLRSVADAVHVSVEVRRTVADLMEQGGLPAAVAELRRLNPGGLGGLDVDNPRRVVRALERCLASGETLEELRRRLAALKPLFDGWEIELFEMALEPAELQRRILARTGRMMAQGLLDEVRRLRTEGLEHNPSAANAIGYRECLAVLDGRLAESALKEAVAASTRALVKKQRTWFRTQLPPHARGERLPF